LAGKRKINWLGPQSGTVRHHRFLLRDTRRCRGLPEDASDGERGEKEGDDEPQGVEETGGLGEQADGWWQRH
jgi:hypothetical protein